MLLHPFFGTAPCANNTLLEFSLFRIYSTLSATSPESNHCDTSRRTEKSCRPERGRRDQTAMNGASNSRQARVSGKTRHRTMVRVGSSMRISRTLRRGFGFWVPRWNALCFRYKNINRRKGRARHIVIATTRSGVTQLKKKNGKPKMPPGISEWFRSPTKP